MSVALMLACIAARPAGAAEPPTGWDGTNPFRCTLQQAGLTSTVPDPDADPYCVEFDKRRQNVSRLGVAEFLLLEPARVAAALPVCFYFQSDHWRGAIVQDDTTTKTYEFDGHYFIDKARGGGGAWVTNLNINGHTFDPSSIPGIPPEFSRHLGPGTGGVRTRNSIPVDPRCVARAADASRPVYAATPPGAAGAPAAIPTAPVARCAAVAGKVSAAGVGPLRLRDPEERVLAALGAPVRVHRGFLRYCVRGGGKLLVGQRGDRSGETGSEPQTPTVFLLTTGAALRLRSVGPGSSARVVARAFPRPRKRLVTGRTHVLEPQPGVLLGVRDGRVRYLAVYDRRAIRTTAGLRSFLRRAR